jgi:hypothetical protein
MEKDAVRFSIEDEQLLSGFGWERWTSRDIRRAAETLKYHIPAVPGVTKVLLDARSATDPTMRRLLFYDFVCAPESPKESPTYNIELTTKIAQAFYAAFTKTRQELKGAQ